ncbi:SDR family oxidoreductase [Oxalobacter sp. OttesenSCG-928-P03]|nr:SDR family oxidoreductase [Oxalobacter sp. OttesenSCG-928-P03]
MDIYGKNILITGGLGDFGAAIARALKDAGGKIFIFDIRDSNDPFVFNVDVTDETAVAEALQKIDRIDILINCAGEIYSEPLINVMKKTRHKRESWDRVISRNLTSCFNMSVQVAQKMSSKRVRGVIINFSSISAKGNAGQAAYSAAKAGTEALTRVIAKEMGMFGIRAVSIAPGFIDTPSTREALNEGLVDYWVRETPLRKLGQVDDIINTVKYIIECDHITGCTIAVDGALSI